MKVMVDDIKISKRIRKDFGDIPSLADDIRKNGLISPIAISPNYELLAGERRLMAAKSIGMKEIDVNIISVDDAVGKLMVEISENENRKQFTFSEKLHWAELLREEYERKQEPIYSNDADDIIAKRVGIGSREKLRKCAFIKKNADEHMIRALDDNQLSVNAAYKQLKTEKERLAKANRILEQQESQASKHIDKLDLKVRELTEKLSARPVDHKDLEIDKLKKDLNKALNDVSVVTKNLNDAENALKESRSKTHVCFNGGLIETIRDISASLDPIMDIKKSDIINMSAVSRCDLLTGISNLRQDLQDVEDMVKGCLMSGKVYYCKLRNECSHGCILCCRNCPRLSVCDEVCVNKPDICKNSTCTWSEDVEDDN